MQYRDAWDLASIPDEMLAAELMKPERQQFLRSVWGRFRAGLRETHSGGKNGGRPPEMVRCPKCGKKVSKTQAARGHANCLKKAA